MRKAYIALLCAALLGCAAIPEESQINYDFRLAVIDNGSSGLEITYYDDDYREMGRIRLPERLVNNDYTFHRDTLYHDSHAYMLPAAGIIAHQNELIRMNLENGQIDYVELEDFAACDIFADDEKLEVIQSSPSYVYWRTEIPFDGGRKSIVKLAERGTAGIYFPVNNGWIMALGISQNGLYLYDSNFEQLDYLSLGDGRTVAGETPPEDPYAVSGYDGVSFGDVLYVPVQKENRRWEKTGDNVYEVRGFEGYSCGLMKIRTDPLSYEVTGDPERRITDIEQLDETRIILCTCTEKVKAEEYGNETHYSYEYSPLQLSVFDIMSEEFTDLSFSWHPQSLLRAQDVLYVTDTDEIIHVLDPDTLTEITALKHEHSDAAYSLAALVSAQPYR